MSTNPFRRSSLKGPGGSSAGNENHPLASTPIDNADAGTVTPPALTVNTKVAGTTQKHVNFASPPAIPISPISYPPSPESTRITSPYTATEAVLSTPIDYSSAFKSHPFLTEQRSGEDSSTIEQALENAKINSTIGPAASGISQEDAIRNTLSRFASAPTRAKPADSGRDVTDTQSSASQRQTMDVDAFKRLLLTGDTEKLVNDNVPATKSQAQTTFPTANFLMNDNSSATDTASLSQRSLFDPGQAMDDSPRSSDEIDRGGIDPPQRSSAPNDTVESRKKPPPPTPRHGKPIKEEIVPEAPSPVPPSTIALTQNTSRKPPTPPLARRRSQNNTVPHSTSRKLSSGDMEQPTTLNDSNPRAPPPPKPRRPVAISDRRSSSDLPTTLEESDSADSSVPRSRKSSDSRPAPPPTRNSHKRASMGTLNPPPIPPPRRGRGSSRSSIDSQRPSMSNILGSDENQTATDASQQIGDVEYAESTNSSANDILADLAALQREVDEARRRVSR